MSEERIAVVGASPVPVTTTTSPGPAGATKKTTPRKLMSGLRSQKTARHRLWNGVPHA